MATTEVPPGSVATGSSDGPPARSAGLVVGGVGTLVLLVARVVLALRADRLTVLPDEVGFLGDAWLLGRGQPAPPMGFAPFYPAGQPLVLAPVAALTGDTEVLQTAARLVDVVLLAAVVPVLITLLSRLGRLRPGPRALAAVTATALPGLWVAAVVVWPDALATLLWPLALLALHALAGRGRLVGRIWFGPALAALWVVHARFLPVVVLGALLLVVRLCLPADAPALDGDGAVDDAAPPSGILGVRTADAVNLVLGAVVLGVGVWLDHRVAARWDRIPPGPLSGFTDDLGSSAEGTLRSLAGQTWYAMAATAALAALGAGTLGRLAWRARRRARALWTEPRPLVALAAVTGWVAVVAGAAVQLRSPFAFGTDPLLDLVANGRYQEVVLVPLVAVGAARILRPVADLAIEAVSAVALVVLAVVVGLTLGRDPGVLDGATASGITWATSWWTAHPLVIPSAVALVVLAAARFGRPGARRGLVVVLAVAVGFSAIGVERASEVVARSRETSPVARALPRLRDRLAGDPVAYRSDPDTLASLTEVSWGLAEEGMTVYSPGQAPPEDLVVTSDDLVRGLGAEALPEGARLSTVLPGPGLALWALPGPAADRLAEAGLLYPASRAEGIPPEAREATVEPAADDAVATADGPPLVVRVTHTGTGAVWPARGRPGDGPVDLVLAEAGGATLRVPVGEVDPGAGRDVRVSADALVDTFGPGSHVLDLSVDVDRGPDLTSPPVQVTLEVI